MLPTDPPAHVGDGAEVRRLLAGVLGKGMLETCPNAFV